MDVPSRASLACRWPHRGDPSRSNDRGYAMAALLVGMAVMGIMLSMALPVWRTAVKREREAELVFRGEQYAQAIELFSRRNGGFPPSLAVLEEGRYIRKLYKDPMTEEGDFQPVYFGQLLPGQATVPARAGRGGPSGGPGGGPSGGPGREPTGAQIGTPPGGRADQPTGGPGQAESIGAGPIIGVVSKSTAESLRLYNDRDHYNEWAFVAIAATAQPGAPGGTLFQGGFPFPNSQQQGSTPRP
jgi:type II secretory pathway pseudopilin PulG